MGDQGFRIRPDVDSGNAVEIHHTASDENVRQNEFWGVTLKTWAISAISAIAVLTAVGTGLVTVYGKYESLNADFASHRKQDATMVAQNASLTGQLQTVNEVTQKKMSEAEKHLRNKDRFDSIPIENNPEIVTADFYPSDGCIHVVRKQPLTEVASGGNQAQVMYGNTAQDIWIPDPNRLAAQLSPDSSHEPDLRPAFPVLSKGPNRSEEAAQWVSKKGRVKLLRVSSVSLKKVQLRQGACLNPHPGTFQVQNRQVNACQVQVWRRFLDGCVHYQMYNACTGQWTPGVIWTFCVAQHRW
jgi:hypothetical protein